MSITTFMDDTRIRFSKLNTIYHPFTEQCLFDIELYKNRSVNSTDQNIRLWRQKNLFKTYIREANILNTRYKSYLIFF